MSKCRNSSAVTYASADAELLADGDKSFLIVKLNVRWRRATVSDIQGANAQGLTLQEGEKFLARSLRADSHRCARRNETQAPRQG